MHDENTAALWKAPLQLLGFAWDPIGNPLNLKLSTDSGDWIVRLAYQINLWSVKLLDCKSISL